MLNRSRISAMLLNASNGSLHHVANVLDAHGVQLLVFNKKCWAGPEKLPAHVPANMPRKHYPNLMETFGKAVRASAQLAK